MVNVVYAIRPVLCCHYNGLSNERPDNILAENIRRALKLGSTFKMAENDKIKAARITRSPSQKEHSDTGAR
jgi:hypothetical protein